MIESLLHIKLSKEGERFAATVRTEEFAILLLNECVAKGMPVDITVLPPPHYFRSKQEHVDHLLKTNPDFAEFYHIGGFKLS